MAVNYTNNKSLAEVTVGTEAGTWGPYINGNAGQLDTILGGVATIALTNANVILSSAQYLCNFINFTGAITANINITFPSVGSFYTIQNLTSNTSTFQVTLITTAAGGQVIGCPWGEAIDIMTDGTNVKFRNLGRVGAFWEHAGSSVPAWVSNCSVPPYLNCDGTAFSSAVYPILYTTLGNTTTLPDLRGRIRATLNQGTGRITAAGGGVDGNTNLSAGGAEATTLSSFHIPNYALPVTDPGHLHSYTKAVNGGTGILQGGGGNFLGSSAANTGSAVTGISVNSGGSGTAFTNLPPMAVAGITMVRSA